MTIQCVFCGKEVDGHSDSQQWACMRRMARSRLLRVSVRFLKFFVRKEKNEL